MPTFFKPISRQLPNGKWVSKFRKSIRNGDTAKVNENSLDVEFDTKDEANKNATNYCIKMGYLSEN